MATINPKNISILIVEDKYGEAMLKALQDDGFTNVKLAKCISDGQLLAMTMEFHTGPNLNIIDLTIPYAEGGPIEPQGGNSVITEVYCNNDEGDTSWFMINNTSPSATETIEDIRRVRKKQKGIPQKGMVIDFEKAKPRAKSNKEQYLENFVTDINRAAKIVAEELNRKSDNASEY